MAAFKPTSPFAPELEGAWGQPESKSKYGGYDLTPLQRLAPSNAPAAPDGAVASRGALQAPPPGGASMSAFSPGDEGKGVGEARKPKKGTDFFGMWKEGDTKDREAVAENMQDVFAQQGLSLEGATKMIFNQGGEAAARIGEKYGLVPPEDKAGMPAFKTREQAVADVEKGISEKEAKKKKRQAMGGFLMEMGLRILASNRDDAGGAIAEGALGTIEARQQRQEKEEMKGIAQAEMERKAKLEAKADTRADKELALEGRRTAAEEKRAETARMEAMKDPLKHRTPFSFEVQRDIYMKAHLGKDWQKAPEEKQQEALQDFLEWESGQSKLTTSQRENIVSKYIKEINDASRRKQPEGWTDMSLTEKREYIMNSVPGLAGEDEVIDYSLLPD